MLQTLRRSLLQIPFLSQAQQSSSWMGSSLLGSLFGYLSASFLHVRPDTIVITQQDDLSVSN